MSSHPIPWYVALNPKVARQITAYDRLTKLEVGGMGLAADNVRPDLDKPHVFVFRKAWLMSMGGETSVGYCEVPAQARAGLMFRLASRGLSDSLKFWWH